MGYGQLDSGRRLRSCIKGQGHMRRQEELPCPANLSFSLACTSPSFLPCLPVPALSSPACTVLSLSAQLYLLLLPTVAGQSVNKVADSCSAGTLRGGDSRGVEPGDWRP